MRIAIQNTDRTCDALRYLRERKHLTLAEVAERANRSVSTVYRAEHNPSLIHEQLRTVAKALGCRVEVHLIEE